MKNYLVPDDILRLSLYLNVRLWQMVLPLQLQDISNTKKNFYHPQGKVPRIKFESVLSDSLGLVGFAVVLVNNTILCLPDGQVEVFGKVLVENQITDTEVVSVRDEIIV